MMSPSQTLRLQLIGQRQGSVDDVLQPGTAKSLITLVFWEFLISLVLMTRYVKGVTFTRVAWFPTLLLKLTLRQRARAYLLVEKTDFVNGGGLLILIDVRLGDLVAVLLVFDDAGFIDGYTPVYVPAWGLDHELFISVLLRKKSTPERVIIILVFIRRRA